MTFTSSLDFLQPTLQHIHLFTAPTRKMFKYQNTRQVTGCKFYTLGPLGERLCIITNVRTTFLLILSPQDQQGKDIFLMSFFVLFFIAIKSRILF